MIARAKNERTARSEVYGLKPPQVSDPKRYVESWIFCAPVVVAAAKRNAGQ